VTAHDSSLPVAACQPNCRSYTVKCRNPKRSQATGAADGLQSLQPHLPAWAAALRRLPAGDAAAFAGPLLCAPASGLLVQVLRNSCRRFRLWNPNPVLLWGAEELSLVEATCHTACACLNNPVPRPIRKHMLRFQRQSLLRFSACALLACSESRGAI
jgi:hypothetical protein